MIPEPVKREHLRLFANTQPRPRVCIFSMFNDAYAPLADIARPNWKAYAERHGYAVRWYPGGFHLDPSNPTSYGDKVKFQWFYDLRGYCDITMFLDIDSLFMNFDCRIEDRIGSDRFFWTYDESGPLSGLMIARSDEKTEKHLRAAYERAAIENNVRNGQIEPNGISDQDSMTRLMNVPPFDETFGNCGDAEENGHCFPENWKPGKWIIGFPGRTVAQKREGMLKYAKLAPRA
jgi:hypothetical protein